MKNQDDFTTYFKPKSAAETPGIHEKYQAFSVKSIDAEKRQITGVASSEIIDRDGEIVSIEAIKRAVPAYMQNPVILAAHKHRTDSGRSPVVGSVVAYKFQRKDFIITVQFADTELGREYWELYKNKHQRAFSMGFGVKDSKSEIRNGKTVRVITSIELYEISCVAIPANPAALVKAKNFVAAKRLEREQKKILDNPDLFEKLLDRYEAVAFESGDIPEGSDLWEQFSAAEKQILLELQTDSVDFAESIDKDWPGEEIDCGFDDFVEDYEKSITGDSGAAEDDFDFPAENEPDYMEYV